MIRIAEDLNEGQSRFQPPFYKFICNGCGTVLYVMPLIFSKHLIELIKDEINLCKDCYSEKTQDELSKIARMSSEIVIKEMSKIQMHKKVLEEENIKKEDPYLKDLKDYLESKRFQ